MEIHKSKFEQDDCPEDKDACVTLSQKEFWEDFEDKIAWGGDDYENHEEGVIEHADLQDELKVLTVDEPTGNADLEDELEVPTVMEDPTESVVAMIENEDEGRWAFEARGESRESC